LKNDKSVLTHYLKYDISAYADTRLNNTTSFYH
jgi:hypothetical protein